MLTIRMLSAAGGYACGTIQVVPDDLALLWIRDGTSELVRALASPAARLPEVATAPIPERAAIRPKARRR